MRYVAAVLLAVLIASPAMAETTIVPCVVIPGTPNNSCQPVTTTNPLPVVITKQ